MKPRPGWVASVAVVIMLVGWVISAGIRSWQHVEVNVGVEMTAAATASALLWRALGGKPPEGES